MKGRRLEMKEKQNNKGFTLAELLIVVAIIGVLVAISIPIFHAQLRKARLATNQANGRAAFSAAEAAYLDYVAGHGSIKANRFAKEHGFNNATYTYFPAAGKGILNFHYNDLDNRWIVGGAYKLNQNTNVSSWTVYTIISEENINFYKSVMIGDQVAKIWTIHMNPDNGEIKGYYCAFPKNTDSEYKKVLQAFADGTESQFEQDIVDAKK